MASIDIHKHNIIQCITMLAKGNPGACTCLCKLLEYTFHDHCELPVHGVNVLRLLDKYGIYGTDIYVLWNDICDEDYFKVLELLSAVEIGFLDSATLCDACSRQDYSGKNLIDVDQIVHDVKSVLPYFNILETLYKK